MQTNHEATAEALLDTLSVIVRSMRRLPQPGADQGGMWLLAALDKGDVRTTSLAQQVLLDASTVSRHLDALQAKGLVERRPDPADGRARLTSLTPAGKDVLTRLRRERRRFFAAALADWPDDDLATLNSLATRLAGSISTSAQEGQRL